MLLSRMKQNRYFYQHIWFSDWYMIYVFCIMLRDCHDTTIRVFTLVKNNRINTNKKVNKYYKYNNSYIMYKHLHIYKKF